MSGAPSSETRESKFTPKKFGKYLLLDRLFESAMSELFLGLLDNGEGLHRMVVIKKPHSSLGKSSQPTFEREMRVGMTLSHPNIVQVLENGQENSEPFIAMEWIQGKSLKEILLKSEETGRKIPPRIAASIIYHVAAALSYAHEFRDPLSGERYTILHRDLSPHNVMVSYSGEVKLVDFGIAKILTVREDTVTVALLGKPSYLSPEQIAGEKPDGRCDLFVLGIIFYELLTGEKLFKGDVNTVTLAKISSCDDFCPPLLDAAGIPVHFRDLLKTCLRQKREERFPSAAAFAKAIRAALPAGEALCNASDIAPYMQGLFAAEIQAERQALSALVAVAKAPAANFATTPPAPEAVMPHFDPTAGSELSLDLPEEEPKKPRPQPPSMQPPPRPAGVQPSSAPRPNGTPVALEQPVKLKRDLGFAELPENLMKVDAPSPRPRFRASKMFAAVLLLACAGAGYVYLKGVPPLPNFIAGSEVSKEVSASSAGSNLHYLTLDLNPRGGDEAAVFIDGRPAKGNSPGRIEIPGDAGFELMILKKGFKQYRQKLPGARRAEQKLALTLEPQSHATIVGADAFSAIALTDGKLTWRYSRVPSRILVPEGTYTVQATRGNPPSARTFLLTLKRGELSHVPPKTDGR